MHDNYPLRNGSPSINANNKHSLKYTATDFLEMQLLFTQFSEQMKSDPAQTKQRTERQYDNTVQRLPAAIVAREFARYSAIFREHHQQDTSERHLQSAYALLHRQVREIPFRSDRVQTAGMAAAVLACAGMQVHLVVGSDLDFPLLKKMLLPVFETLGYSMHFIETGDDEKKRRAAYRKDVTIVSARECAMDFLRDAVNWPQRGNKILRKVDCLLGGKSRQQANLMRGLPGAIFLDVDRALIDSARAPIVLTQNAHPMHEVEELKQALEMVEHLKNGRHFILTGDGAELAFTEEGKLQLKAWADQLGGNWQIQHVAELMLAVAIVVQHLIKDGVHYRIRRNAVEWLLDDSLVPGIAFYSKAFLSRMIELRDECDVKTQREVAARASYQQIFNRYVHLSGLCHSSELIEKELLTIYGLRCGRDWPVDDAESGENSLSSTFDQVHILKDNDEKMLWLKEYLDSNYTKSAILVLVNDTDMLGQLRLVFENAGVNFVLVDPSQDNTISKILQPAHVVLSLSETIEHLLFTQSEAMSHSLKIIVTQRAKSRSEDLRNLFWLREADFEYGETLLLLSEDDDLFTPSGNNPLKNMLRFFGEKMGVNRNVNLAVSRKENQGKVWLEKRIRQAQLVENHEMYKVRLGLLNHDATMHDLLSFSGRGLYE